jgi:hypothetical protein
MISPFAAFKTKSYWPPGFFLIANLAAMMSSFAKPRAIIGRPNCPPRSGRTTQPIRG